MSRVSWLVVVAALASACGRHHRAAVTMDAGAADAPVAAPSFARDIEPVLAAHCARTKGCHGAAPTDSVDLDLRSGAAYDGLVGRPAEMGAAHLLRVAPGDPAASLLLHKLTGALGEREGKAMPLDPDTGAAIEPSPLPPDFVDSVLTPWIVAGAPRN